NAVSTATDAETVTVANANALSISVDESEDTVAQGGTLTYDLTFGNRGLVTLTGTTMTFPVPAGSTFVSASGGGSFSAGAVTWNLGSFASGDSGRRQVVVTVGAGLADGQQLVVDAAVISGTGAALETARALAFTAVRAVQSLGLGLETGPDPVQQGESMHPR